MLPEKIQNKMKRINIKSKRRKCLFKKAIELRHMCDVEVLVIIKDLSTVLLMLSALVSSL